MTDWDLLTPGIGLTTIGIVGVGVSLSGIAKTFIDGMHAVSLLTMFIGMIFLASGLFKDGFPSSGRAKSGTFITLGFLVTFGVAAAVTVSAQVPSIFAYIGLMAIIGIPGAMLAFISYRKPEYLKAMAIIFIGGSIVAGTTFYAFGLVAPKPPAEEEEPTPVETPQPPANIVKVTILAGASSQDNPDYDPDPVVAAQGEGVEWTNEDNVPHTVTSKADDGATFDSGVIAAGKAWLLDTSDIALGDYEYYCYLHPFMTAMLQVAEAGESTGEESSAPASETNTPSNATDQAPGGAATPATVTAVSIAVGSSAPTNGEFFVPDVVVTTVGSMVTWTNNDATFHTVTSGVVEGNTPKPDGRFDSSFMKKDTTFQFLFESPGEYDYYCSLHLYMTGKVIVE
ncbi:cupredoxin domain-containing protein [Nitrososphaera sp.]|uniref:cupredoxin domain-containing protein n=1 Tax=Nitrososphaera sp. TaxID=1971748 RepID=UPI002EDAAF94